jgi:hypothetical protein
MTATAAVAAEKRCLDTAGMDVDVPFATAPLINGAQQLLDAASVPAGVAADAAGMAVAACSPIPAQEHVLALAVASAST